MARTDSPSAPVTEAPFDRSGGAAWAALVYALATFALGWPALLGRFLVNPRSDQYIAGYAFREFAAASLRAGEGFPLWNPYLFGGMPYVAAMHGDIFYPTFLLRMALPTDIAMTWGFVLHLWLAGFATYLFLRRTGVGFQGALVGGLAYLLSGPIAAYASPGHDGKLFVSALFPLALCLMHIGVRGGKRGAWGALALVIGLAVLSPHPQLLMYLLLGTTAYGLFLLFTPDDQGALCTGRQRLTITAQGVAAGVLGGLIGLVQFLPFREYLSWSPRAAGGISSGYEHAISYSFPPEELINTVLPQFSGILDAYWGRNGIHFHSEYLGVVALLLAAAALGGTAHRALRRFFIGLAIVSTLWALGGYTPFFRIVYAIVPGTTFFRAPSTIMFLMAFAVSCLAALGTERILGGGASRRWAVACGVTVFVLVGLAVSGGLANLGTSIAGAGRADLIDENQGALTVGAMRVAAFAALALGLAVLVALKRVPAQAAGWGFAMLVGVDLWTIERQYWQFSDRASVLFATNPAIEFVKRQQQPARVLAISVTGDGALPRDPYLNGDALMTNGVRTVLGYHGNELARYQKLLDAANGMRSLGNPNFWALTNTQFMLTGLSTPVFPGMTLAAGPVRDAFGSMVYLYRMPGDNPMAWVTPAMVKASDDQALATVLDPRFNVRTVAVFDSGAAITPATLTQLPAPLDNPVTVTSWAPGRISMTLATPAPAGSALMVSENYYPGWAATVDDKPATIGRADLSLIGVALPAGATRVDLTFRSATYETGKAISLAALTVALLWLAAGFTIDRRLERSA